MPVVPLEADNEIVDDSLLRLKGLERPAVSEESSKRRISTYASLSVGLGNLPGRLVPHKVEGRFGPS